MTDRVTLVGFDIGTTTSRAAFADAQIVKNARSGSKEFGHIAERAHASSIMTPFSGEALDEGRLVSWMDQCFTEANIGASDVFGGGGLLTGLAARASNASAVADALRARVANAVIATADDPKLEAWLAFQGSVGAISRAYPSRSILNLDIGGGTTNAACGRDGNVFWTEWSWVGARHIVVRPGTYVIERCSAVGQETLDRLSIRKLKGDELTPAEVDAIVGSWVRGLEDMLRQTATPNGAELPEVAFSGGVGELVYAVRMGKSVPGTTHWGDLGIDLARAICARASLTERIVVPTNMGRATLYGLVEHQTQVSGTTIFLPNPDILPLGDIPIVATVSDSITDEELHHWAMLAAASRKGAAVHVRAMGGEASRIRNLGRRVGKALDNHPSDRAFVLLLEENAAKAIGGYATHWGLHPRPLVVLDELVPHAARFAHIGRMHGGMVFISFHGFGP
jgi:ethanolamine utilization protein EutA